MTISAVQENSTPVYGSNITSGPIAFGSDVTAGNVCLVGLGLYMDPNRTPNVADLTKTGGTATIGTIAMDTFAVSTSNGLFSVAIYSFIVSGSGSLTLTWNGGQTGSYFACGYGEYSATNGWDASRLEDSSAGEGSGTASSSGDATSADGSIFFGVQTDARGWSYTTTPDAAFTQICENEDPTSNHVVSVIRRITSTGLTDSASWTNASASWAAAVGVYKEAEGGGASVTPSTGTLRFVGAAPTVTSTANVSVAPSVGTLRFVGQQLPLFDTSALVDFDTPAKNLLIGANQQTFRVLVRKNGTTAPTVDIDLYEGGSWVADLVSGTSVTSDTGQIVTATWNASLLADISGAGVQCFIYGHSSVDAQVEIGAVEWQAELEAVQTPTVGTLRFAGAAPSVAYTDHVTVAPSVGTLLFAGQQPSVTSSAAQSVAPSVGTLRFEGLQPTATVSEPGLASPQVGTIRFLGQQPSVGYTHSVAPLSAVVRLEGAYPSVTVTANEWTSPGTGTVQFNGQQPSTALTANIWVEPSHGTLRLDGQQPELVEGGDKTVSPYHGVLRLDGRAPSILGVEPPRDVMFGGGPTRSDRKKFKDWLEELNRNPIVVSTKTGVVRIRGNRPIVGVTETYDPFVVSKDVLRPLLRLPRKRVAAQATDNVDQMIAAEIRYAEELQAKKRKKRRKQDEEILLLM